VSLARNLHVQTKPISHDAARQMIARPQSSSNSLGVVLGNQLCLVVPHAGL
jgi:hypothetical protein